MAVTTVAQVFDRVKTTLQELATDGTRWTNDELLRWLNESYQAIISLRPDASAVNEPLALVAGTKQTIPAAGLRLLDVVRNLGGNQRAIIVCTRRQLDSTRRDWHSETESSEIEHYIFDEMDPKHFYVYPPAVAATSIEIIYSQVPTPHDADYDNSNTDTVKVDDNYVPAIVDYMLYRAYSKDADHAGNANRAAGHYQAFNLALGNKVQVDGASSPNNDLRQTR